MTYSPFSGGAKKSVKSFEGFFIKITEPLAEIRMFRPTWLHVAIEFLNASIYGVAAWEKSFMQNPQLIITDLGVGIGGPLKMLKLKDFLTSFYDIEIG